MNKQDFTDLIITPLKKCTHGEPSGCIKACPFDFDVRKFIEKIKTGSFAGAFNIYREAVIFPGIVQKLCSCECEQACEAVLKGEGVKINEFERTVYDTYKHKEPVNYNAPKQNKSVALVGAELVALSCAYKLAQNGYDVKIYTKNQNILSELDCKLSADEIKLSVKDQFDNFDDKLVFDTDCKSIKPNDFDAIVVTDAGAPIFDADNVFFFTASTNGVYDIQIGKIIAKQTDWFLRTAKPYDKSELEELINRAQKVVQKDKNPNSELLSKAEVRALAQVCTGCDCSECLTKCAMLREAGITVADLKRCIGLSLNLFEHTEVRDGMRQIGGCNFCGLCKNICPEGIDIGKVVSDARSELYAQGVIPKAHHEYFLRDMAFSNSDEAALSYSPAKTSKYMFFPGCQAGGSDKRYVSLVYENMLKVFPDTSLLLYCCGAPLLWEGDKEGMAKEHDKIRAVWEKNERPTVITICPSCYRMFKEHLSDIPVKMLYEVLTEFDIQNIPFTEAAVFDPCAARDYPELHEEIRHIAAKAGIKLSELEYAGDKAQCCSWGGHTYNVNRNVANHQAEEQIGLSDLSYITYCTNCRDIFASKGKSCRHILDIIYNINTDERPCPNIHQRRVNRYNLKKELIEKYNIASEQPERPDLLKLIISDELNKELDSELILYEDISAVITEAERTSEYIIDSDTNHRFAHQKRGVFTYWAEYIANGDGSFTLVKAYSHRMNIKNDIVVSEDIRLRD